jgi:hypothetical protein
VRQRDARAIAVLDWLLAVIDDHGLRVSAELVCWSCPPFAEEVRTRPPQTWLELRMGRTVLSPGRLQSGEVHVRSMLRDGWDDLLLHALA